MFPYEVDRPVGRAIVYDDRFEASESLVTQGAQAEFEEPCAVPVGDDDRGAGWHGSQVAGPSSSLSWTSTLVGGWITASVASSSATTSKIVVSLVRPRSLPASPETVASTPYAPGWKGAPNVKSTVTTSSFSLGPSEDSSISVEVANRSVPARSRRTAPKALSSMVCA